MINQMIKRAVLTLAGLDDKDFCISQVMYNGRTANVEMVYPYGLFANAPANSLALLFNIMNQEQNRAAIPYYPQIRFKPLLSGEVVVGNPLSGANVKFDTLGNTIVTTPLGEIVTVGADLSVTVTGNASIVVAGAAAIAVGAVALTVDGDVSVDGSGHTVNLLGNYHLGGSGGPAIARVGDQVVCPAGTGTITTGSGHHTAT